jgi:hypothetical protein
MSESKAERLVGPGSFLLLKNGYEFIVPHGAKD